MTETKRCSKCGEVKPLTEFHKNRSARDGLDHWCKSCKKESMREYCEKNRELVLKRHRRYTHCVKNPSCPAVGRYGAEYVTFACEVCGKEFRRNKSHVDWNYEHEGRLPRFCSRSCTDASKRKDYKSPYARNIERIKKAVGA